MTIVIDYNGFAQNFQAFLNDYSNAVNQIAIHPFEECEMIDCTNTPFATNPPINMRGAKVIVYNSQVINECNLSIWEQYACLLHEVGHLIHNGQANGEELEKLCDEVAQDANITVYLISALYKMREKLDVNLQPRIDTLISNCQLFRPEWTCGRYDINTHSAIAYNLIEGLSHSFVDASADVMGVILSHERNTAFSVKSIVEKTGILESCIVPFVEELVEVGLLVTDNISSQEGIARYRAALSEWRKEKATTTPERTEEKLPMEITNAEMEYTERVGGVTSVMFEMTYRCPEKCIHCYNPGATRNDNEKSHRGDREELCIEDYKRIADELYEQGLFKVCLSGGDPFSNKATWELIEYLYNKEVAVDIFTNGLSIQHETERLANLYPRLVGLSLYSGDANEHDFITRIKGSWGQTLHVAKELSQLAVPMNLKCCVMRPNFKHYREVNDIANSLGAKVQYEISITDSIEGDKCASKYLRLSQEQMEKVLRNDNVPLYVGKEAPNYGGQAKELEKPMCGAAFNSFCITPEGNLIPCCAFHLIFGSLKTNSIKNILEKSKDLREWRNAKIGNSEECGKHEYCAYCNLCPGNNYSEHHNYMRAAENNCWLAKVRYDLAMKMMKGYEPLEYPSKAEEVNIEDIKRVFS